LILWFGPALTELVRRVARLKRPKFLIQWVIRFYFIKHLKVDTSVMEKPAEEYQSVVDFFTRRLKPGSRPLPSDPLSVISPADARLGAWGRIEDNFLFQVKGSPYSLEEFLGSFLSGPYRGGDFITLYLSPRDYHRVHHPYQAWLREIVAYPGAFFPVHQKAIARIPRLYARNKRLGFFYETENFPFMMMMVGALNVASVQVTSDPDFYRTALNGRKRYALKPVRTGEEAGAFELGSTVVLIFPPGAIQFETLEAGRFYHMGETIARLRP
jgi:phosphatidylserine decarboxylase